MPNMSGSASNGVSEGEPAARRQSPWPKLALFVGLACLGIYLLNEFVLGATSSVVTTRPGQPERLSPQLRSYLLAKTEWVDEDVGDPERHRVLGLVYEANRLWGEAYASFATASTLDPHHSLTQYHEARSLIGLGRLADAEALLGAIVKADPALAPAACRLGELLLDLGDFEAAREVFALVIEHAPKAPHGYLGQGAAFVLSGSPEDAVDILGEALARNPNHPRTHYLLGLAYRALGRREEALRSLKLGASSEVEELPDAWRAEMARHSKQLGDQIRFAESVRGIDEGRQSVAVLEEALRWNPESIRFLKALAITYQELGQCDTALAYLARAREVDAGDPGVMIREVSCLVELKRLEEAELLARKSVAAAPSLSASHMVLGLVLHSLERNAEALVALGKARELEPRNSQIAMKQAQIAMSLNRRAAARRYLEEVVELTPSYLPGHLALTRLHMRQGQWELAKNSIQKAMALAPKNKRVTDLTLIIGRNLRKQSR